MAHGGQMRFGLWYDFRRPEHSELSFPETYQQTLEHIRYAEQLGIDDIWLSEHHFIEDGYLPSVLAAAAAIAAITKSVAIGTNVLLVPFHHPVTVAEEAAVVDIISGGRFIFGPAVGYRVEEFEGFGVPRRQRGGITEEALQIIIKCWTEEEFDFDGRYFKLQGVRATPKPVQRPRPPIWMGAAELPAIQRAGRYADGILGGTPEQQQAFAQSLRASGRGDVPPRMAGGAGTHWIYLTEDPERAWHEMSPHLLHQINNYMAWFRDAGTPYFGTELLASVQDLKTRSPYVICTPEECVATLQEYFALVQLERYFFWAIPPGLPPRRAFESLELFAKRVIPHFRAEAG